MATATASFIGVCSLLAIGCGGGDSTIQSISTVATTSTTSTVVATDEFITSADARCAEANAAIANLSTDTAASSTAVQQQLEITKQVESGLKALGDPEDPDGSLADFYAALKEQASILEQQQTALSGGDTAAADALTTQLDQAETDAETAGQAFGFGECGQQGTTLPAGSSTTADPAAVTPAPATTTPAPVTPAPAPVTPPATGGGTGTGTGAPPAGGGGTGGSASGGISAG